MTDGMKMTLVGGIFTIVGAVIGVVGNNIWTAGENGVSDSKYNNLKADYDIVVSEKEELVGECDELKSENSELQNEIDKLQAEKDSQQKVEENESESESQSNTNSDSLAEKALYDIEFRTKPSVLEVSKGRLHMDRSSNRYETSLHVNGRECATFDIQGEYDLFKGVFCISKGVVDKITLEHGTKLTFLGDGNKLYETDVLWDETDPIDIEFSVSGVNILEIEWSGPHWSNGPKCFIGNPTLIKN